jgi:hypothetical protein
LRGQDLLMGWRAADWDRAAQIFQSIIAEAPHSPLCNLNRGADVI